MRQALAWANTLSGRLTIVLALGSTFACGLAWVGANTYRDISLHQFSRERIVLSVQDVSRRLDRDVKQAADDLAQRKILGVALAADSALAGASAYPALTGDLERVLPDQAKPVAFSAPAETCIGPYQKSLKNRVAGFLPIIPECQLVGFTDSTGRRWLLSLVSPPIEPGPSLTSRLPFLFLAALVCIVLSALVARATLQFMNRLSDATRQFAFDVYAEPIAEEGPSDVTATYRVFNAMQQRIRNMVAERTDMLAAISHDLQTPLARLRLRSETVEDAVVREKLLADIGAMERLVREGIALAQAHVATEEWADVDLASVLGALVEDAQDEGKDVTLGEIKHCTIRVRPDALLRCLQNLLDNAVQYGKSCHITCTVSTDTIDVNLADEGPGIADADIEQMFLPFVRGEKSRSRRKGGTGIGLTIARAQASTFGACVELANRNPVGLIASLRISRVQLRGRPLLAPAHAA